jgi:hypothetical protein
MFSVESEVETKKLKCSEAQLLAAKQYREKKKSEEEKKHRELYRIFKGGGVHNLPPLPTEIEKIVLFMREKQNHLDRLKVFNDYRKVYVHSFKKASLNDVIFYPKWTQKRFFTEEELQSGMNLRTGEPLSAKTMYGFQANCKSKKRKLGKDYACFEIVREEQRKPCEHVVPNKGSRNSMVRVAIRDHMRHVDNWQELKTQERNPDALHFEGIGVICALNK